MISLAKTINIVLAWIKGWGGAIETDLATNNTTDTWVPVMNSSTIQHRVIPANANAQITNNSHWVNGDATCYRRGNTVTMNGSVQTDSFTTRTTIGTIPAGYRPACVTYSYLNADANNYLVINTDGTIQAGLGGITQRRWFSVTYVVNS